MGTVDQKLKELFYDIKTILETKSILIEIKKNTKIDTDKLLENIADICNDFTLLENNNRIILKLLHRELLVFVKYTKNPILIQIHAFELEKAYIFIKNNTTLIHMNSSSSLQYFFLNSKNSNLNFKIDKIKIENFKQYKAPFSIEFSDQINIIIGQNATGKTSLLQAVTLGLLKKNFYDAKRVDYNKFITKGENEAKITIVHNDTNKVIKIKKDEREIDNDFFIPFVLAYGSNFFTKYNISADKIVDDMLSETVYKNFAHTIFRDYTDEFWNPLTLLNEFDRSSHEKAKEKREIIFKTINRFLVDYKLVKGEQKYFFQKGDDKTPLYLEDLSEGYRSNVLLITDMLVKILGIGWTPKSIEGVVLIDEFDKHLHPKWQSKLVNQLTETFPKIQFIMTTHNPMSILDRNPDEIMILKETDDGIKAIRGEGTKNIDISGVLLEYFGVEMVIGKSLEKKITRFTNLNIREDLSKEENIELEELREKLSKTVAVNFINDYRYFEYLKTKESKTPKTEDIHSIIDDLGDVL